jgi:acetolactate synthase-1/3 small subunit
MTEKNQIHTISFIVANKPGVLSRIAVIFARRGFNIDALSVSPAFNQKYSRMTITAQGDLGTLEQIIKQSDKLIDVLHVSEHTQDNSDHSELALIKIKFTKANRPIIDKLCKKYNAKPIDETNNFLIVRQIGITEDLNELEKSLKKYGIMEMVRSGKLVMATGESET